MAEYIEREAAKRRLNLDYAYAAAKLLDEVDAADVVPVVHGRWIEHKNYHHGHYIDSVYECSACECIEPLTSDYCPNCGARMDGE